MEGGEQARMFVRAKSIVALSALRDAFEACKQDAETDDVVCDRHAWEMGVVAFPCVGTVGHSNATDDQLASVRPCEYRGTTDAAHDVRCDQVLSVVGQSGTDVAQKETRDAWPNNWEPIKADLLTRAEKDAVWVEMESWLGRYLGGES